MIAAHPLLFFCPSNFPQTLSEASDSSENTTDVAEVTRGPLFAEWTGAVFYIWFWLSLSVVGIGPVGAVCWYADMFPLQIKEMWTEMAACCPRVKAQNLEILASR